MKHHLTAVYIRLMKLLQEDFSIDGNLNCEEIVAGMNSCIRNTTGAIKSR